MPWAYREMARIAEIQGGADNHRTWIAEAMCKADLAPEAGGSGDGARQGGGRVMARFGVARGGKGALQLAGQRESLNTENYIKTLDANYSANCAAIFAGCEYTFTQDGAICRTSNAVHDRRCEAFQTFIQKRAHNRVTGEAGGRQPTTPDLSPTDYFARGWPLRLADQKEPRVLASLQVAIRQAARAFPTDMVRRAIDGYYQRIWLAANTGGWLAAFSKTSAPSRQERLAARPRLSICCLGWRSSLRAPKLRKRWGNRRPHRKFGRPAGI